MTEPVVIKIYDDQWRWKQEKEIYVYQLLEQHAVGPVPAVLHRGDTDNALERCYTVMTMLRGRPLSAVSHGLDRASLREIYRQIGGCMAAVHQIPQDSYGYLTTQVLDPEPTPGQTRGALRRIRQAARRLERAGRPVPPLPRSGAVGLVRLHRQHTSAGGHHRRHPAHDGMIFSR
ncbi:phosphotransferase [Streptomyces sp. NPDC001815]|uniref:phosphotransferase n=1 Tax=Streptomyces sp. NPDC001815 TaxID=3154526 RepID=UPI00332467CF